MRELALLFEGEKILCTKWRRRSNLSQALCHVLLERYMRNSKVADVSHGFFSLLLKFLVLTSLPHAQTQMLLPED